MRKVRSRVRNHSTASSRGQGCPSRLCTGSGGRRGRKPAGTSAPPNTTLTDATLTDASSTVRLGRQVQELSLLRTGQIPGVLKEQVKQRSPLHTSFLRHSAPGIYSKANLFYFVLMGAHNHIIGRDGNKEIWGHLVLWRNT
uniref:Uncharacterized protein n=1 Tax=Myotis myotis TaxID=51298 RepID=A0A7J7TJB3_MYOMY|nr:hypothetical protein mMyoMyo1_009095 [Myotis myotis]